MFGATRLSHRQVLLAVHSEIETVVQSRHQWSLEGGVQAHLKRPGSSQAGSQFGKPRARCGIDFLSFENSDAIFTSEIFEVVMRSFELNAYDICALLSCVLFYRIGYVLRFFHPCSVSATIVMGRSAKITPSVSFGQGSQQM